MSYKGYFRPKNSAKYKGNPSNIIYRSGWELKFMKYLDESSEVLSWSSEEIVIPYRSPIDGKIHRYFPDFYVKRRSKDKTIETLVIEIKPKSQVLPPKVKEKVDRRYLREVKTYGINSAKWEAAKRYCENKDWAFVILTEKDLKV